MSRSKRKRKKIQRHLKLYRSTYLSLLLIAASSVIVMGLANMLIKEESRYKTTVKKLVGSPEQRYQKALSLLIEGDDKQAWVMMFNLARLGDSVENPLGFGKAHLWVANDKLSHFNSDFIWKFPGLDQRGGNILALPEDEETAEIQLHLSHAISLNPELKKAYPLWAATLVSQGKRNQAVEVLMNAVGHEDEPHPQLHIPLAHVLAMKGNDLELKDRMLYLFDTLGRTTRHSRGTDISGRITYILSAIILRRYEIADNALQILESRFSSNRANRGELKSSSRVSPLEQVRALRLAYHYNRAVAAFKELPSGASSGFAKTIDELELVVQTQPDCESAIAALSYIADRDPSEKERVKNILQKVLSASKASRGSKSQSQVNISLATLDPAATQDRRKLLEEAVVSDPQNAEAILQLTQVLLAEESPDYLRVEQMIRKALRSCDAIYHADLYHRLGEVQVHYQKWQKAIVSLERSLSKASDQSSVHQLLAEAYGAIGQADIAAQHRELAVQKAK